VTSVFDSLASDIFNSLSGDARIGSLRRETSGGLDEFGDPLPPTITTYAFRGWTENYTAEWLAAGIPATDVRVLVLAGSISTEPRQGDKVQIESRWWMVSRIEIDPAGATFSLQCSEVSAPS
jgi:hypothetical protein